MASARRLCILLVVCGPIAGACGDTWDRSEIDLVEVDGNRLIVGVDCSEENRASAEESSTEIVVTYELRGAHMGDCYSTVEIALDDPVGEREIIDAETGEPAPIGVH